MNDLFTTFQSWVQGQVNACVDGLLARVTRLEGLNIDDQITGLRMENDALHRRLESVTANVIELRDRIVEGAPDQALTSFEERVYECFDSQEFREAVEEYVENSDNVCTLDDMHDFIDHNVSVELNVSRC